MINFRFPISNFQTRKRLNRDLSKSFFRNLKNGTGFTLIEIVVSIAILVLIAAAATVSFSNSRSLRELATASQNVLSILRAAQSKTLAGEENSPWGVRLEQTQVTLFRGSAFSGSNYTEVYPLPATIEIANISLAGSVEDVIFKRIEGTTDEFGTFELRVKSDTSKVRSITIENSGKVYETSAAPAPTGIRRTDTRHRALALGWSIQDAATTTLTFENPPYPNTVIDIPMAAYFDAGKTKFDWSGSIAVGTSTQTFRLHTTLITPLDTILHVDRDCRTNTKRTRIDIDGKFVATYEADCRTLAADPGATVTEP